MPMKLNDPFECKWYEVDVQYLNRILTLIIVFLIIICRRVVSAVPLWFFLQPLWCLCGASAVVSAASAVPLRLFLRLLRRLCDFMLEFCFTSRSISILRPIRPQFYVQNSTSILRPIRSQFHVQFDLNFTSNSISILHPIRPQFCILFDLNFTSNSISILRPYIALAPPIFSEAPLQLPLDWVQDAVEFSLCSYTRASFSLHEPASH